MHQRPDLLAGDGFADGVVLLEVEDEDGDVVVEAEREGGRVHDVEPLLERLDERELVVFDGVVVLFRVLVVDAVHLGGLHDDVGVQFRGAEGGGGVGGEIRVAGAGDEDDDAALLKVAHGAAHDERLGDLVHRDGGLDAGLDAHFLEAVHDGEAVDDGREHAHVVAGGAVDAAFGALQAAEDVAAADHDAHLHAEVVDFLHLFAHPLERGGVDRLGALPEKHFPAQFEDDTFVLDGGGGNELGTHAAVIKPARKTRVNGGEWGGFTGTGRGGHG